MSSSGNVVSPDPKTRDWLDFANMMETQGLTLADVKRKIFAQPKSQQQQGQLQQALSSSDDDFVSDMMRIQKQALKMRMYQDIMRANGLMGNGEEQQEKGKGSSIEEMKKVLEEAKGSGNKFTKDDIMMFLMLKMLQSPGGREGFSSSDMIQLMQIMNQKGSTWQDALTFLQQLEHEKEKGREEGKSQMQAIYNQPRDQTFDGLVDDTVKEGLRNVVKSKINELFEQPEKSGIIKSGQLDAGELAKQIIDVAKTYVKKMPAAQQAPKPQIEAEPLPAPEETEVVNPETAPQEAQA
jgi:hypothetical protein